MKTLQDLLILTENEMDKDVKKAVGAIKRQLKAYLGKEQAKLKVEPKSENQIEVELLYDRVLDKKEFDTAHREVEQELKDADETGRWTIKDTGSYFADPAALKPKRGQMMDQGALLCDIVYTVTVPRTIRR